MNNLKKASTGKGGGACTNKGKDHFSILYMFTGSLGTWAECQILLGRKKNYENQEERSRREER